MRPKFVENVSLETINQITDCILNDEIINTSKKGWILEKSYITEDKARRLIDTVIKMGPEASANFISHFAHVDPKFHLALGLSGSQLAKSGELTVFNMENSFFAFSSRNISLLTTSAVFLFKSVHSSGKRDWRVVHHTHPLHRNILEDKTKG